MRPHTATPSLPPQPAAARASRSLLRAAPTPPRRARSQLVGFPLELLGVTTAGVLALRYLKEGVDPAEDIAAVGATLADTLPGLKEK